MANGKGSNAPLYAMITIIAMILAATLMVIFAPSSSANLTIIIGLIVTTIPSLVAAIFSERAARDIRNGVVAEKAKEGAKQAIDEKQVLTRQGPHAELIEQDHVLLTENNEILNIQQEGNGHGRQGL